MISSLDHHAYIVAGSRDKVVNSILDICKEKFNISTQNNPDFTVIHFESFGIDESRKVKDMQSSRPLSGDKKIFIISTNSITVQAQNAMLKVFEEPTKSTHFFIVVPSFSFLIDTLLSRVVKLDIVSSDESDLELIPKKFLTMAYPERLKVIEKFLKKYKDIKENKSIVHTFMSRLQVLLAEDIKKNKEVLEKIFTLQQYVFDTSESLKILLETLVFSVPVI